MFYKIWHLVEKEKKCRYDKKNLFQNLKEKMKTREETRFVMTLSVLAHSSP